MPDHLPVFSHLVSQQATRLVVQHHFYLRKTGESGYFIRIQWSPETLSEINVISYHVYLNSGTSHGRLWKNSEANNRNMLKEEQREGREDDLLTTRHGGPEAAPNPRSP